MNDMYIIEQLNIIINERKNPTKVEEVAADLINKLQTDKTFFNSLTASEVRVFKLLKNKFINTKTFVSSTTSLADECGVSRTVVSNCLTKMVNADIITYQGLGSKGTLITLLNPDAMKDY